MIKLAMLLVGARALRRRWAVLATLGLFWIVLGLAIMVDASNGVSVVTTEAFAVLLLFEGFIALSGFTLAPRRSGSLVLFKALALIVLALMILDFPIPVDLERSLLFGLAFLIDGAVRITTAAIVRFPKWQVIAAGGALELGLGALVLSNWPVSHHQTVPFCIGLALLLSGWTVLR
ncbi:MAG: protease, partial [Geminicoccaceae bacterium]